jgi:DNA-binding MarR family transcriptional regulator
VRSLIRARQQRLRYLPADLFAEPAWDMMLDLLHAETAQQRVSISSLCQASGVPATTALRWINTMVEKKLFLRRPDPRDGRRVHVQLAPELSASLRRYFAETFLPCAP